MLTRRMLLGLLAVMLPSLAQAMRMRGSGVVATTNVVDDTATLVVDDTGTQVVTR